MATAQRKNKLLIQGALLVALLNDQATSKQSILLMLKGVNGL